MEAKRREKTQKAIHLKGVENRPRETFLLPWVLLILGFYPLILGDVRVISAQSYLLAVMSFLFAVVGGLFSRFPVRASIQFFLVLGFSLLSFEFAVLSSYEMLVQDVPILALFPSLLAPMSFMVAFYLGIGEDAPIIPSLGKVGDSDDLVQLAGALEGLAIRKGLPVLFIPSRDERIGNSIYKLLSPSDLFFKMPNGYIAFLQSITPEKMANISSKIAETYPGLSFVVENWRRGSLKDLVLFLEAQSVMKS